MDFKGIIEHYKFEKLSVQEREKFLIEKKIFVKSDRPLQYLFDSDELYNHYTYDVSKIFANNLKTSKGELTLNSILLDAVTEEIINQCKERFDSLFRNEELYREQFYAFPPEQIEEIKISTRTNNGQNLSLKLYFELNKLNHKYFHLHLETIKNFVKYDHKFIYDYLIGHENKSTYFYNTYHSYILNNIYLNLLDEIDELNELVSGKKGSIPKKIALMNELGMLENDKFKILSNPKKAKVIAYLIDYELGKNGAKYLVKQITSLKPESTSDPKGKASLHMHTILKEVLNS